jgi:hypothetical protein
MNAHLNNTGTVFSVIRSAGSLELVDLVARCNIAPDELFEALDELIGDNLIKVDRAGETCPTKDILVAVRSVAAEVSKAKHEVSRADLFFALKEKYKEVGRIPVAAL